MTEKKHISVRLEQETRNKLDLIAKRRMMATGEAVTLADLIREGLAKFAAAELVERPKLAAPKEDQHDLFNVKPTGKPHTDDELADLRAKAQALSASGLSGHKIAAQLGVNQTMVSRKLLK